MPVPEQIRRVERPKNTVVYDNGKDGPRRYAVRERKAVKYIPGGNPQPQNGKVIGHIIGDSFVPLNGTPDASADMLSYGASALVKSVSQDILDDLLAVNYGYCDIADFETIGWFQSSVNALYPDICMSRLSRCCIIKELRWRTVADVGAGWSAAQTVLFQEDTGCCR